MPGTTVPWSSGTAGTRSGSRSRTNGLTAPGRRGTASYRLWVTDDSAALSRVPSADQLESRLTQLCAKLANFAQRANNYVVYSYSIEHKMRWLVSCFTNIRIDDTWRYNIKVRGCRYALFLIIAHFVSVALWCYIIVIIPFVMFLTIIPCAQYDEYMKKLFPLFQFMGLWIATLLYANLLIMQNVHPPKLNRLKF